VLNVKLRHLDEWTSKRQHFSAMYREALANTRVTLPEDSPEAESVYHLFVAYVAGRDDVRKELEARGVQTAVHYPKPIHLQEGFAHLGHKEGSLPHTERACQTVMSMPLYPEMTLDQVKYAASCMSEIARNS
jgi:dTDP-4-amino-4,6-dideoxygalactose transaminase